MKIDDLSLVDVKQIGIRKDEYGYISSLMVTNVDEVIENTHEQEWFQLQNH